MINFICVGFICFLFGALFMSKLVSDIVKDSEKKENKNG